MDPVDPRLDSPLGILLNGDPIPLIELSELSVLIELSEFMELSEFIELSELIEARELRPPPLIPLSQA